MEKGEQPQGGSPRPWPAPCTRCCGLLHTKAMAALPDSGPRAHGLGNQPGNWWMQTGARNEISANDPYSSCRNRDESASDERKLDCSRITFSIGMKINGGNRDSGEVPGEVVTSVFTEISIS